MSPIIMPKVYGRRRDGLLLTRVGPKWFGLQMRFEKKRHDACLVDRVENRAVRCEVRTMQDEKDKRNETRRNPLKHGWGRNNTL